MNPDFLIVGAGVIGLSAAQALLQRGASVTVLDRSTCGSESSWAGGGILAPLCPWDYPDEVTRLTSEGARLFPAWAKSLHDATGIDPEFDVSGMLVVPPHDMRAAIHWCAEHDAPIEVQPASSSNITCAGEALLLPEVAQARNPRLMRALRMQVESLGGRIVENCEVSHIEANDNRVGKLQTSQGELRAGQYIVASGAWSKQVLRQHALNAEIKPMRGQMLLFKFPEPPLPHIVLQRDLYLIPRRDGHLLVGSTLEDVGFDKSLTDTARDDLRNRAEALLPSLHDMPLVKHWAGLRPGSPRNIPAIGRHPQLDNLYLSSGHFRYGVTMAPASTAILVSEIFSEEQAIDIAPYRDWWQAV